MVAKIIQFPKNALMQDWEIEEEYRAYYEWEEQFYLENGYYPHNDPNDEYNSEAIK